MAIDTKTGLTENDIYSHIGSNLDPITLSGIVVEMLASVLGGEVSVECMRNKVLNTKHLHHVDSKPPKIKLGRIVPNKSVNIGGNNE